VEGDDLEPVLDDDKWARRQRFWRDLVESILASIDGSDAWPTWEPKSGDGTKPYPREYQSICDGRSSRDDRAFSIDERPAEDRTESILAWVKNYAADLLTFPDINDVDDTNRWFEEIPADERVPRSRLMIFIWGSDATTDAAARSLLEVWLRPATTVEEMSDVIARTIDDGLT
jgi:hypothetical protein